MSHRAGAKRSVRSTVLGVVSAAFLATASVFGFASAAQAAWVSPDELESTPPYGWGLFSDGPDASAAFTECAIQLSGDAYMYYDPDGEIWSFEQLRTFVESIAVSVSDGSGDLYVVIDRIGSGGMSDFSMTLSVGVNGVDPTDAVDLYNAVPDLGIGETPTLQEVWDALEATGDDFNLLNIGVEGSPDAEVQWVAVDGQTYWFGTNATWFTDDPTCGAVQPTRPDAVQTAVK